MTYHRYMSFVFAAQAGLATSDYMSNRPASWWVIVAFLIAALYAYTQKE